ncbi:MAG TPA: pyridoxal phosphate-dependent aminotransferase [Acidobacteriota bacterium]|nr:pyridoxal phosphate-dependent aminotransferase [Acidobacteriota bacterium]
MSISTSLSTGVKTKPTVSSRAEAIPSSPIRKLVDFATAAKSRGIRVYHLNIGQPDVPTPPVFFEAVRAFDDPVLSYGHSKGQAELLKAWSGYYAHLGLEIRPEQIQITNGGSEGMSFSLMIACNPGENAVTSEPFYTNYRAIAAAAGVQLRGVPADPQLGYALPARAQIERAIDDKTRAIIICSPNNPTGTLLTRDEIATVVQIAVEHNLFIISDEVYREFCYEGTHTSIWQFPQVGERAIMVDSISKRFSACGARVGAISCRDEDVIAAALRLGQARLCSPTLEQHAAVRLMGLGDDYYAALAAEYKGRRDLLVDRLLKIPGVMCRKPQGAFYLMVTLPVDDTDAFCKWMLTDFNHNGETVMMAPGAGFYATPGCGTQEVRIAYVLEQPELDKAAVVLAAGLKAYPRASPVN